MEKVGKLSKVSNSANVSSMPTIEIDIDAPIEEPRTRPVQINEDIKEKFSLFATDLLQRARPPVIVDTPVKKETPWYYHLIAAVIVGGAFYAGFIYGGKNADSKLSKELENIE